MICDFVPLYSGIKAQKYILLPVTILYQLHYKLKSDTHYINFSSIEYFSISKTIVIEFS